MGCINLIIAFPRFRCHHQFHADIILRQIAVVVVLSLQYLYKLGRFLNNLAGDFCFCSRRLDLCLYLVGNLKPEIAISLGNCWIRFRLIQSEESPGLVFLMARSIVAVVWIQKLSDVVF